MKRRLMGIGAAVLLAAVGATLLVAYVRAAEDRAVAGELLVDVLVLDRDVPAGTPVAEVEAMTRIEQIPAKVQIPGALEELSEVQGLVTSEEMFRGEQLNQRRFVEQDAFARSSIVAPSGLLEVTMSLEPERALGGTLRPGDTVALIGSYEYEDYNPGNVSLFTTGPSAVDPREFASSRSNGDGTTREVLPGASIPQETHIFSHKVLVTNVQIEERSVEDADGSGDGSIALAPTGNLLVTFALPPDKVESIVHVKEWGLLWVARQDADAATEPTSIVTSEQVYRNDR